MDHYPALGWISMGDHGWITMPAPGWISLGAPGGSPTAPRDIADTTYLPVLGGFLFLVVILDLFSREFVGWSLGNRLDAKLSSEALRRVIARRHPGPGLLFPSDRGSEFAAESFRTLLAQIGAVQSMSRKGDCRKRRRRELLFDAGVRGPAHDDLAERRGRRARAVHLHREPLQREEAASPERLQEPERNRVCLALA